MPGAPNRAAGAPHRPRIPTAARGPLLVTAVILAAAAVLAVIARWVGDDTLRAVARVGLLAGLGCAALIFGAWGVAALRRARRGEPGLDEAATPPRRGPNRPD